MNLPNVVSRPAWRAAREALLVREKDLTRRRDALAADRRALPMVQIEEAYELEGPAGRVALVELFEGRRQLLVYHFMFDPGDPPEGKGEPWSEGCSGCSFFADNLPHLAHLHARDTTFALVSRAPLAKILPFKRRMGWSLPWYSSFGSDFNLDFHATLDASRGSTEWNYRDASALRAAGEIPYENGELPGLSVFLRDGAIVYHTYSTYARGLDALLGTYQLLDLTPCGRGEGWGGGCRTSRARVCGGCGTTIATARARRLRAARCRAQARPSSEVARCARPAWEDSCGSPPAPGRRAARRSGPQNGCGRGAQRERDDRRDGPAGPRPRRKRGEARSPARESARDASGCSRARCSCSSCSGVERRARRPRGSAAPARGGPPSARAAAAR